MTVNSCVDCGTTILGERPRCPRCHDDHARTLVTDADVTATPRSAGQILLQYLVAAQFVAAIVLGAAIALTRGCR